MKEVPDFYVSFVVLSYKVLSNYNLKTGFWDVLCVYFCVRWFLRCTMCTFLSHWFLGCTLCIFLCTLICVAGETLSWKTIDLREGYFLVFKKIIIIFPKYIFWTPVLIQHALIITKSLSLNNICLQINKTNTRTIN